MAKDSVFLGANIARPMKAQLKEDARALETTVSALLEHIIADYLSRPANIRRPKNVVKRPQVGRQHSRRVTPTQELRMALIATGLSVTALSREMGLERPIVSWILTGTAIPETPTNEERVATYARAIGYHGALFEESK